MRIGGLHKVSLIDYPGKVSSVIFTQGCNFRCFYCHNPELVYPDRFRQPLSEDYVFTFLEKRKKLIDGIVITGGEPTIHSDLPQFIEKLRKFNLPVKLDTNGSSPAILEELVSKHLINFIAMDIKATFNVYDEICKTKVDVDKIMASISIIKNSKIPFQFRTTEIKTFHKKEDFISIKKILGFDLTLQVFKKTE